MQVPRTEFVILFFPFFLIWLRLLFFPYLMTGVLLSCYLVPGKPLLPGAAGDPGPLPHFHPGRQTVENASGSDCCWTPAQPKRRLSCGIIKGGWIPPPPKPLNLFCRLPQWERGRLSVTKRLISLLPHNYSIPGHWRGLSALANLFNLSESAQCDVKRSYVYHLEMGCGAGDNCCFWVACFSRLVTERTAW